MHNGIDPNPNKLKQLEVERLELGLYMFSFLSLFLLAFEAAHSCTIIINELTVSV